MIIILIAVVVRHDVVGKHQARAGGACSPIAGVAVGLHEGEALRAVDRGVVRLFSGQAEF
jgi:hypothetical protein